MTNKLEFNLYPSANSMKGGGRGFEIAAFTTQNTIDLYQKFYALSHNQKRKGGQWILEVFDREDRIVKITHDFCDMENLLNLMQMISLD